MQRAPLQRTGDSEYAFRDDSQRLFLDFLAEPADSHRRAQRGDPSFPLTHRHTLTRTHTDAHTRAHTHTCTDLHTHANTHTHARAPTDTRTHAHTHARTHARTRSRTHARTHARKHAHTHAHTHARTHAHTQARTRTAPRLDATGSVGPMVGVFFAHGRCVLFAHCCRYAMRGRAASDSAWQPRALHLHRSLGSP